MRCSAACPRGGQRVADLPQVAADVHDPVRALARPGQHQRPDRGRPGHPGRVAQVRMTAEPGALEDGGVVIADSVAAERGLAVGDTLADDVPPRRAATVACRRGDRPTRSAQALSTNYILSLDTYATHYSENVDATVYVALKDGVDPKQARAAMRAAVADFPNARIRDQAQARPAGPRPSSRSSASSPSCSGSPSSSPCWGSRTPWRCPSSNGPARLGLLRAVGMTRAQLRRMVRAEAVLVAGLAAARACPRARPGRRHPAGLAADNPVVIRVPPAQLMVPGAAPSWPAWPPAWRQPVERPSSTCSPLSPAVTSARRPHQTGFGPAPTRRFHRRDAPAPHRP